MPPPSLRDAFPGRHWGGPLRSEQARICRSCCSSACRDQVAELGNGRTFASISPGTPMSRLIHVNNFEPSALPALTRWISRESAFPGDAQRLDGLPASFGGVVGGSRCSWRRRLSCLDRSLSTWGYHFARAKGPTSGNQCVELSLGNDGRLSAGVFTGAGRP